MKHQCHVCARATAFHDKAPFCQVIITVTILHKKFCTAGLQLHLQPTAMRGQRTASAGCNPHPPPLPPAPALGGRRMRLQRAAALSIWQYSDVNSDAKLYKGQKEPVH